MSTSDHTSDSETKRCSRCHDFKPKSAFCVNRRLKDGLNSICRDCAAYVRAHLKPRIKEEPLAPGLKRCSRGKNCLHPEGPILPSTTGFFTKHNTEKDGLRCTCKACSQRDSKAYDAAHPDKKQASNRKSYLKDAEQRREYGRRYHAEHREEKRAYSKWRKLNVPEWFRAYNRQYKSTHLDEHRTTEAQRSARKRSLPDTFCVQDWDRALRYFNGACAYCGNPPSLFDVNLVLHQEHWIPLSSPDCPGTIPTNILPACQSCNFSKSDSDPVEWLTRRFGKRKARKIEQQILAYFRSIDQG